MDTSDRHKKELRKFVKNYKTNACKSVCLDCKLIWPEYILQFDHVNPKEKTATISELIKQGVSLKRLLGEIMKCELVCANCHLEREHKRIS
jgi:hypothetical protein